MKKILPLLLIVLFSCSVHSQLNRTFMGKDIQYIEKNLKMKANKVQNLDNGLSRVIFIKEKDLGSSTIAKGEGTLDPMTTPPVSKKEYYTFILDNEGKVIRTDYQKEYEKK
ncbi:hypothetical protein ACUNWD_02870 [Sunxiuqinia sp. A32]|uniref:hypothetical protein n=1 Tax=Sunxiuqinia sp. A32 TaxID=3461496 RepID=UPI0040456CC3